MNFGMGKIWQTACVVKVHVSHEDMTYIRRLMSQSLNLMESRLVNIARGAHHPCEKLHLFPWICEITNAKTGIHKHGSLICFDQQASNPIFH